jgi:hypothetical protein
VYLGNGECQVKDQIHYPYLKEKNTSQPKLWGSAIFIVLVPYDIQTSTDSKFGKPISFEYLFNMYLMEMGRNSFTTNKNYV